MTREDAVSPELRLEHHPEAKRPGLLHRPCDTLIALIDAAVANRGLGRGAREGVRDDGDGVGPQVADAGELGARGLRTVPVGATDLVGEGDPAQEGGTGLVACPQGEGRVARHRIPLAVCRIDPAGCGQAAQDEGERGDENEGTVPPRVAHGVGPLALQGHGARLSHSRGLAAGVLARLTARHTPTPAAAPGCARRDPPPRRP